MDYDGANQHQVTHLQIDFAHAAMVSGRHAHRLHVLRPVPRRHFGADLHLFHGVEPADRVSAVSRNEQLAGVVAGRIADRIHVQPSGDPEIYVSNADGAHLHRITFAAGVSTSPAWNPKTGKQMVFVSDRGGDPALYLSDADGSNVQKNRLAGHGLRDRPVVVTKWTTARI